MKSWSALRVHLTLLLLENGVYTGNASGDACLQQDSSQFLQLSTSISSLSDSHEVPNTPQAAALQNHHDDFYAEIHNFTIPLLPSESCDICPGALAFEIGSPVCCLKAGQREWGESHLFQVMNAALENGKLRVHGAPEFLTKVQQCYKECHATWFEYVDAGVGDSNASSLLSSEFSVLPLAGSFAMPHRPDQTQDQAAMPASLLMLGQQSRASCVGGRVREAALVITRYFASNFYHNVIDTLFTSFLTASHLSFELGCHSNSIDVLSAQGQPSDFDLLWERIFGAPMQNLNEVNACYRRIVYGFMYNQRFFHWNYERQNFTRVYRSPKIMPWTMAFSQNLRSSFLSAQGGQLLNASGSVVGKPHLILAHHGRFPKNLWEFKWETLSGISIAREDMASFPLAVQVEKMLAAEGIISMTGAAFTHQIFLPTYSALLVVTTVDEDRKSCSRLPETWHDNVALHLGHTSVNWKACEQPIRFTTFHLQAILSLLLMRRQEAREKQISSICFLLQPFNASATYSTWPVCDRQFTMPVRDYLATCGSWKVGSPIREDDEWFSEDLGVE